jgi:hypothetical protein
MGRGMQGKTETYKSMRQKFSKYIAVANRVNTEMAFIVHMGDEGTHIPWDT